MDFELSAKEQAFKQELNDWLGLNLPPGWMEGNRKLPEDPKEQELFLRAWQRKLSQGGWAGVSWPKEYGGRGSSLMEQSIYDDEMLRFDPPLAIATIGLALVGPTLMQVGTPEQKQRYLSRILSGEELWCQGYSEPDAGSDLAAVKTNAVDMGDHFLVNGQKVWTSFAHMADFCFLLCRTDPKAPRHKSFSVLIVDMKSPGIECRPINQINNESDFNEVFFTDVKVPKENLVGNLNEGWRVAVMLLAFERRSVGAMVRTDKFIPQALELLRTRKRNGIPLINDPLIRDRLAQIYIEGEITKLNFYRGLTNQLRKGFPGPEGSFDKIFASELNKRMQSFALEMLGDDALHDTDRYSVPAGGEFSYNYLMSFQGSIGGGTTEIQRNIVGERILGLPRD